MAQKSQNATNLDSHPNASSSSSSSTSPAAKDSPAASAAGKPQPAAPAMNGTISTVLPNMSDPTPPPPQHANSASSQPMEKSASAGSSGSSKDAAGGTASPYGTRSRNRNGTSRINYAEDKDLDVEMFETYPVRRDDDSKKPTRQAAASSNAAPQGNAPRSINASSRKPLPDEKITSSSQNGTKEPSLAPTPGSVSGANSTTSAPTSRKRKAASQASGAGSSQTPAPTNGHSAALQKRLAVVSQAEKGYGETNLLTFENCGARPKNGKMVADDGTILEVNNHVYLVCEPPGEPYYLARIMEFLHAKNNPSGPVDALRINWYYRPKDIGRKVQDTRLVFATMHSDICPLTSLRGKCQIRHKSEIPDLTEYKRSPDSFWYEKLYDRYIQKNYEVIPTSQIVNVPERVKKVLDQRWNYILVEQGRGKELTSAMKLCKRCSGYCASNDSVDCAVCKKTYHMNCVRPALLKKPSRGFAWSCAACSRAQERKLEARNTPNVHDSNLDAEEEEYIDDEEDDLAGTGGTTPDEEEPHEPATAEQIYHASLWPYRYLGIHCKVEDALDYDDRIFPRASTRLGPRHQAIVLPWAGRPVEYVKPLEIKKSTRKDGKLSKEVQAALEQERIKKEKRPKWIQDEPAGYVARGEDYDNDDPRNTAQLLWKPPADAGSNISGEAIDDYMETAKSMAKSLALPPQSTNLQDVARDVLFRNNFDVAKSLRELPKLDKSDFREPELTPAEQKKFEEGVQKFGSELYSVKKHVKTVKPGNITRYYYTWKKTDRGRQVWGNYASRKGKKEAKKAEATANKLADDVADGHDDSAFDTEKALDKKKSFMCKFCSTKTSRQWRRAPNASTTLVTENGGKNSNKDKNGQYIQALCRRCAELWRRYAIQWEDIDEVAKKVAQTGGRGWRRRVDEELYKELQAADEMINKTLHRMPDYASATIPAASSNGQHAGQEPPRKKLKGHPDREAEQNGADSSVTAAQSKKKAAEKPAPPPVPEIPKPRTMPCAICLQLEPLGDQHLSCRECRMTVHRNCYGIIDNRAPGKWTCDMCLNDKNPQVSIHYKCVLCPIECIEQDFVGPPKPAQKKKTEKERERDRVEREAMIKAAEHYKKKQEEMNRPVNPREPLKRTADNNWVHVTCAVWTPEVKFAMAKALGPCEGIPSIPRARYAEVCKACRKQGGACVACHQCRAPVHVECAHQAGYLLGFDITPVKGSRRDQFNIVTINGETGTMAAAVWCKEHVPAKKVVHRMEDPVDGSGLNALQLYVQNFKQADLTLTGCARKANQISLATRASAPVTMHATNRRASTTTLVNGDHPEKSPTSIQPGGKVCLTCGIDVSPKWHSIDQAQERGLTNGHYGNLGAEAQKFVEQRSFQCHRCKRENRQPNAHPPRDPTPEPPEPPVHQPVHQPVQAPIPVGTPPPPALPEPVHPSGGAYTWSPQMQPAPAPMPPLAPLQAPLLGPISASIGPPPGGPPPARESQIPPPLAPRGPHVQPHSYPPPGVPYNDWHRRHSPQLGPHHVHSHREINGGPPPMPPNSMPHLAPPNHLRPPPPMPPNLGHQPPPPPPPQMHNPHVSQPPFANGLPPSPRRLSGPPPVQNGSPSYMQYHHPVDHRPEYGNGGGQPLSSILRHRTPLSTPHASPPTARDSLPMGRESNPPPPPPPQRDGRPASGASASPSLRNLLS